MSADWADKPEAVPYSDLNDPQSLNLYGYVRNNPLSKADADGHDCCEQIKDFFVGLSNAYISDNVGGIGRVDQHTMAGQLGSVAGDVAAAYQGIQETVAGSAGVGGGLVYSTLSGEQSGSDLAVVSVAVTAHGVVTSGVAAGNLMRSSTGPKASGAPGVTAGGQATDKYGNKLGPSGKSQVDQVDHSSKKSAKDAARQAGKGAPENHPSPTKGDPHYHPTGPNGEKQPTSTHHNYPE